MGIPARSCLLHYCTERKKLYPRKHRSVVASEGETRVVLLGVHQDVSASGELTGFTRIECPKAASSWGMDPTV